MTMYPERMNANSPQCSCRCRSLHVPASNGSLNQNTGRGSLTNGTLYLDLGEPVGFHGRFVSMP